MADRFGYGEIGLDIHTCRGCEDYDESDGCKSNGGCGKPITNADKIRAMTDKELAEFMALNTDCYYCRAKDNDRCASLATTPCGDIWLDWLKQEADDDLP